MKKYWIAYTVFAVVAVLVLIGIFQSSWFGELDDKQGATLVVGLIFGFGFVLVVGLVAGLTFGLTFGLIFGLIFGLGYLLSYLPFYFHNKQLLASG